MEDRVSFKSTPKSDGLKNEAFGVNAIVGYTFRSRHTTYSWEVTCYHLQWRHSRPNREMPKNYPIFEFSLLLQ